MAKIRVGIDVQFYPDGEVILFIEDSSAVKKVDASAVIDSMIENARGCEWLSLAHAELFANQILDRVKKERRNGGR